MIIMFVFNWKSDLLPLLPLLLLPLLARLPDGLGGRGAGLGLGLGDGLRG